MRPRATWNEQCIIGDAGSRLAGIPREQLEFGKPLEIQADMAYRFEFQESLDEEIPFNQLLAWNGAAGATRRCA